MKTYTEILTSTLGDLTKNTSVTKLSAGGKARALYESFSLAQSEVYKTFNSQLLQAYLSSSSGQGCDFIGALVGCVRESPKISSVGQDIQIQEMYVSTGTFGSINSGNDISIPRGSLVSTLSGGKGILYKVIGDYTLPASSSSYWIGIEAIIPGASSNVGSGSLVYHTITSYTDYLNNSLLTRNVHGIANGQDEEGDTNYKYRISKEILRAASSNETALRIATLLVPGVSNVTIRRNRYGIGTTSLILESITSTVSSALIASVQSAVAPVTSSGELVFVSGPEETGISIEITVTWKKQLSSTEMDTIESDIRDTVESYFNGLGNGDPFITTRLLVAILSANENIQTIGTSLSPFDVIYIYKLSEDGTNRIRQSLVADYYPAETERVILESSISTPVVIRRKYL